MIFAVIACLLVLLELAYFRVADRFNIIDKPNLRSSHQAIVLRGGGIISVVYSRFDFGGISQFHR